MDKDEFKFLIINTRVLWEEGEKDKINVTEKGISIEGSDSYTCVDTFLRESVEPVSLDLDPCGTLYVLDKFKEAILISYLRNQNSCWVDCLSFPDPRSIAVNDSDIYVLHNERLLCLARVNCQMRWEREITEDIRIASLGKNHLYILDRENKKVFKADREWDLLPVNLRDKQGSQFQLDNPVDIASDVKNNIYILGGAKREIIKFDLEGRFIEIIPIFYKEDLTPLALAADIHGNILLSFKAESGIILLKKIKKYAPNGVYITKTLDSTIPDCQWHKVTIEADIPDNTQVRLYYYASNEENLSPELFWAGPVVNLKDALIPKAKGKNICFKIELINDDLKLNSPIVNSLKVHFPRLSYLRNLPATYQEDLASKDFLERFLWIFETFLGGLEANIEDVPRLFDTKATPKRFLPWLSTWFGAIWDENWEEAKWREFLSRAVQLYKQKGTRKSLSEIIRIYTGKYPFIVEQFQLKCASKDFTEKVLTRLFGSDPYTFCVLLKPGQVETETERNTVKKIIAAEKPAHTSGGLQVLQPWIMLGAHTYLEVNTFLSKPEFILGKAVLPIDTALEDKEETAQIERHSRTEIDTFIA